MGRSGGRNLKNKLSYARSKRAGDVKLDLVKAFLNKKNDSPTKESSEAVVLKWEDIGPIKNVVNITGGHKTSAVWLGELGSKKVVVKLPGAKIRKDGTLQLPGGPISGAMFSHGTSTDRAFRAELLVDDLLEIAGGEWRESFALVKKMTIEDGFLASQEVLVIDFIDGESAPDIYARDFPPPEKTRLGISDPEKEYRKKAWEDFWTKDPKTRKQIAQDGRRILLIDLITMNSDRHLDNMMVEDKRLKAYDQGMAFGQECESRFSSFETAVINQSGGTDLLKEERELLLRVLDSSWLERVEKEIGAESSQAIRARIDWMLKNDQLYSEKTKMTFN